MLTTTSWVRNQNTVRYTRKGLGLSSYFVIIGMLVVCFGLISTIQGSKATSFDYEISRVESEITELSTKKEDLEVEKARLTSVAAAKTSSVAAAMETATVSGYAAN